MTPRREPKRPAARSALAGYLRRGARARPLGWLAAGGSRLAHDSLLRNSAYIMSTTVVSALLGYIYWIVAARTYSAPDLGLASAVLSAMLLTARISNLGVGSVYIQMLPGRASGRDWSLTLNAGLLAGTGAGLVAGAVLAAILPLLSSSLRVAGGELSYAVALAVGVPLFTISIILDQAFVAERAAGNQLARNAFFALLKIPLLLLLFLAGRTSGLAIVWSWVLAAGIAVGGAFLVLVPRLGRGYEPTIRGAAHQIRSMVSFLIGHHTINLAGLAPAYLLPVLVATRLTPTDNAYFYTAWMVGSTFFIISPAVSISLFAEGSHNTETLVSRVRHSALIIAGLLGPLMLFMVVFGRWILSLFGPSYAGHGWLLLMILVASAVPDAVTNLFVSVLRVQRRLTQAALLNLGMAACTLCLAWALLPSHGIAGVGWAFLTAQLLGCSAVCADILRSRRRASGAQGGAPAGHGQPGSPVHGDLPVGR